MKISNLVIFIFLFSGIVHAGYSSFEVSDFEIIKDTNVKAEDGYKGFMSAHAKGLNGSKLRVKMKNDKDRNVVLSGQYSCFTPDDSKAFIFQGSVDVKFKDKKVKYNFEKVVMAGEFDDVNEKSPSDKKIEEAKKCVAALVADYLKGINNKSDW